MVTGLINSVGALFYCSNTQRYLFLLRNATSYSGTWGLVGGKIDTNETIGHALKREVFEEVGYTITTEKIIPIDLFTSDNKQFRYNTYVIVVDTEFVPKLNSEHRGFCWCELRDIPRPIHPGVAGTIKIDEIQAKLGLIKDQLQLQSHAN
jgi:8-oxo-dGTP pyrophosphatase MutT (NUDIX family)